MNELIATELELGTSNGGERFTLPLSLITSTQAILARKRSGKSYLASDEAEELLEHNQQIGVFDPTGAWWGLRSSADGANPGYAVVVFGGDHADAPLDWRAGKAMAHAFVGHGFSAIFDINDLETEQQIQFVHDFCGEILRINREAVHLFMDEADTFAPQLLESRLQKQCLGTVSRVVKQGGVKGIGFTMITQRSADINKKILSQVDMLTVLRMSHPLDIKPVVDWIQTQVGEEFAARVAAALPSLPVGEAFFCSTTGLNEHVKVRARRTFNSGATPRPGERKVVPDVLAPIDIEKLGHKIAESVKRTREESPEALKRRVAELEAQIAKGGSKDMAGLQEHIAELEREAALVAPLRDQVAQLQGDLTTAEKRSDIAATFLAQVAALAEEAQAAAADASPIQSETSQRKRVPIQPMVPVHAESTSARTLPSREAALPDRVLRTLAEFEGIGRKSVVRATVSAFAGARGGYFARTVSAMISEGVVFVSAPGHIGLTDAGRTKAPVVQRQVTPAGCFEATVAAAGGGLNERILRALRGHYPAALGREQLSEEVDARGGYFARTCSAMVTAGFIEIPNKGRLRLSPWTVME